MKTVILLALLLTGTAGAQNILGPGSSYTVWAIDGGLVNTLPNGEQWLILRNQDGLGIQLQQGMPAAATFETNIVINADNDGSAEISIAADCWGKTYEVMGAQSYQHSYRTGLPVGTPKGADGVIRHVVPGKDIEMVWVFAAVCASGTPGAALSAGGPKLSPYTP